MKLPAFSKLGGMLGHFTSAYVASFPSFVCILLLIIAIVTWVRILNISEKIKRRIGRGKL
ncbi:MAG TPA: hypothetical protein VMZ27_07130 [Candidatus Saccharimonadales bacterium]|nr:hypothetical protein [Candidatus Saccharimonadales bacterium]